MLPLPAAMIGPLGGLVPVEYLSELESSMSRGSVEKVTTGGVTKAQLVARTRRQWQVGFDRARPADVAGFAALCAGEFGYGPFWLVDAWAQVTNLLHPDSSMLDFVMPSGVSQGGPVDLEDGGRAGRHLMVADPAAIVLPHRLGSSAHYIPVVPGQPAIGSVYASGAAAVDIRLTFWDASGAAVSSTSFQTYHPGPLMKRIWRMAVAPANAAAVTTGVRGASRIARPAVTWTDELMDWYPGQGASSVLIPTDFAQAVIKAHRQRNGRIAGVSGTIKEIG